ncbi:hypothetical protein ACFL27_08580 [candidate division CSSED10-310 bacterium]|uniref:Polysaccharide biosynthesis protein C-terminal domain-containing protein n=1 Tax=candidate division CSSED10-310 bacterium TaxID=2855610 RepID=A0ABV6YVM2_UNCC1
MPENNQSSPHKTPQKMNGVQKRFFFGISAVWARNAVGIIVNLIQYPLLFHYLPQEELGIWFLMIGAQMFTGMLDFGFGQTFQRRFAFAKGACGADPDTPLTDDARDHIRALFGLAQRVYRFLSVFVFTILLLGGFFYFNTLDLSAAAKTGLNVSWFIMALGYAANVYGWYVEYTLNGLGDVGFPNLINSVILVGLLIATWIVLACGWGLLALAFLWLIRGVLLRLFGWLVIMRRYPWIHTSKARLQRTELSSMLQPSLHWWLAIVGIFLTSGISRYFIGIFLGVSLVPDFVATFAALALVQSSLIQIVGILTPLLSQMWQAGDLELIRQYTFKLIRLSLTLLAMCYIFICMYGKLLFELWLGQGHFVGYPVLSILCVMMLLEAHHGVLNIPCIAAEKLGFYKFTLLGGILGIIFAIIMIPRWGLIGAAGAIFLAQLLTNNWIIPLISLKLLKYSFKHYFLKVLSPVFLVGISIVLIALAVHHIIPQQFIGFICLSVLIGFISLLNIKRIIFSLRKMT